MPLLNRPPPMAPTPKAPSSKPNVIGPPPTRSRATRGMKAWTALLARPNTNARTRTILIVGDAGAHGSPKRFRRQQSGRVFRSPADENDNKSKVAERVRGKGGRRSSRGDDHPPSA